MNRFVKTSRFFYGVCFFGRVLVAVLLYKSLYLVLQQGQAIRYNLLLRCAS
jgi:hypothetical protein